MKEAEGASVPKETPLEITALGRGIPPTVTLPGTKVPPEGMASVMTTSVALAVPVLVMVTV
ncbi:hypothetical protein D3C86_2144730 [compost metagenome]